MPQTEEDIPYINRNRLTWHDDHRLGEGSFGIVYRGLQDNAPVAIKVVKRPPPNLVASEDAHHQALAALRQHRREIHRLATVQNAYIIQYLGVFRDQNPHDLYIVTEFLEGGSLHDSLVRMRARVAVLDDHSFLQIALHIAYGLNHVHSEGYTHGDVKPQNVLLTSEFRFHHHDDSSFTAFLPDSAKAKIADFGLSKRLESTANAAELTGTLTATGEFGQGPCGTFLYMAPEVYDGVSELDDNQVTAADVYAYALILYELLTGLQSWSLERVVNPMQLMSLVKRGARPAWGVRADQINPLYIALVERCWDHDTNNRPIVSDIITTLRELNDAYRLRVRNDPHLNKNNHSAYASSVSRPSSAAQTAHPMRQTARAEEPGSSSESEEVVTVGDPDDDDDDDDDDDESDDDDDSDDNDCRDEHDAGEQHDKLDPHNNQQTTPLPSGGKPSVPSPQRRPRSPMPLRCADELGDGSLLGDDSVLGDDGDDGTIRRVISCRLSATAEAALPDNLRGHRPVIATQLRSNPTGGSRGAAAGSAEGTMTDTGDDDDTGDAGDTALKRGDARADRSGHDVAVDASQAVEPNGAQNQPPPPQSSPEVELMSDSIPNPDGIDADTLSGTIGNVRLQHVDSTRFPEVVPPEIDLQEDGHLGDVNIPNLAAPRSPAQALDSFLNAGNNYVENAPQGIGADAGAGALPSQKEEKDSATPAANGALKLSAPGDPEPPDVVLDIQAALAGPARVTHRSTPEQLVAPQNESSAGTSTQPSDGSEANQVSTTVHAGAVTGEDLDDLEEILEGLNVPETSNASHQPARPANTAAAFAAPQQSMGMMMTANGAAWHSQIPLNSTAHVQGPNAMYSTAHRLPQPLQTLQPPQPLQTQQRRQQPRRQQPPLQPPLQTLHITHHQANPNAYFTTSHIGALNMHNRNNPTHPYPSPSMPPSNPSVAPPFPSPASDRMPANNPNIPPINLNAGTVVATPMRQVSLVDLWEVGRHRDVAHELANNGRGNYCGDDMLKMTSEFLRSYLTLDAHRREWQVFKDLSTAIGNIAQHRERPIRKESVKDVIPFLLRTMHHVHGNPNPGPLYAAINYAMCNLFKVSNIIADARLRSNIGIWIAHTLHWNLAGGNWSAQPGDEVLGYAATSALRNFTWMNTSNVTALLEVERNMQCSPITLLLETVRLFESRRQPLVVGTGMAAIAPIVHYPRFRMPFIRLGGLKELLRLVNARVSTARIVHLCFTIMSVVFCGPAPSHDEGYEEIVNDDLKNGGAGSLVQSVAYAMRLDQVQHVGGEANQLDLVETGFRALLQALRLSERVRKTVAEARAADLVASGLEKLRRSCSQARGVEDAVGAQRGRLGMVLCEIVRELRREAKATMWMRENGVGRILDELMVNGMGQDKAFCQEGRAAVVELNR